MGRASVRDMTPGRAAMNRYGGREHVSLLCMYAYAGMGMTWLAGGREEGGKPREKKDVCYLKF